MAAVGVARGLGVTVSTVMPMTPKVIPVPDTAPGGTCSVSIPGRPAHLTGVTDIHFIMTFADLRPCFPDDRQTICLTLATTTTVGAQETVAVPARLAQAACTLIGRLSRTEDPQPLRDPAVRRCSGVEGGQVSRKRSRLRPHYEH